jgi:hypothetical protein
MTDAPLPPPSTTPGMPWPAAEPVPPIAEPPRRRGAALFVGLALAVAVIAGAVAFVVSGRDAAEDGSPTALSLAFARGETTRYRISMQMDASVNLGAMGQQPMDVDMTETVAWRVVSVDDDGVATVELTIEDLSGTVNGVDAPTEVPKQSLRFRITPNGQILSTTGVALGAIGGTGFGGFPGMDQMTPILPDDEVKPGDSWDKDFSQEFPFGKGKLEYAAHSTFERYETIDGVEAAVIATTYEVPIDITLDFGELLRAFGGSPRPEAKEMRGIQIFYGGSGKFSQRAWVDLERKEVLRTTADGTFEMTVGIKGAPKEAGDFPVDDMSFEGTFSVKMERL